MCAATPRSKTPFGLQWFGLYDRPLRRERFEHPPQPREYDDAQTSSYDDAVTAKQVTVACRQLVTVYRNGLVGSAQTQFREQRVAIVVWQGIEIVQNDVEPRPAVADCQNL
jgi:hypothetical protein